MYITICYLFKYCKYLLVLIVPTIITMSFINTNLSRNCAKLTRIYYKLLVLYARLIFLLTLTNLGFLVIYLFFKLSLIIYLQIAMFSSKLYKLYAFL